MCFQILEAEASDSIVMNIDNFAQDLNTPSTNDILAAGTSTSDNIGGGSDAQIAKFSGKSNANDLSRLKNM